MSKLFQYLQGKLKDIKGGRVLFWITTLKTGFLLVYGSLCGDPKITEAIGKLMLWNLLFDALVAGKISIGEILKFKSGQISLPEAVETVPLQIQPMVVTTTTTGNTPVINKTV